MISSCWNTPYVWDLCYIPAQPCLLRLPAISSGVGTLSPTCRSLIWMSKSEKLSCSCFLNASSTNCKNSMAPLLYPESGSELKEALWGDLGLLRAIGKSCMLISPSLAAGKGVRAISKELELLKEGLWLSWLERLMIKTQAGNLVALGTAYQSQTNVFGVAHWQQTGDIFPVFSWCV